MTNTTNINDAQVSIPRHNITLRPWHNWEENSPAWWGANNAVKHHRHTAFEKANLENALNAMAALYLSLAMLYRVGNSKANDDKFAKLPTKNRLTVLSSPINWLTFSEMNVSLYENLSPPAELFRLVGEDQARARAGNWGQGSLMLP